MPRNFTERKPRGPAMHCTTCYVEVEQLDALYELAGERGCSVASLIRAGIDLALAAHAENPGFGEAPPDDGAP